MADIEAMADRVGIDLSQVDVDSIELPSGDDFGIKRFPPPPFIVPFSRTDCSVLFFCSVQ